MRLTQFDGWVLLESMIREQGLARQHLNSYNDLVSKGLKKLLEEIGPIVLEVPPVPYTVEFVDVKIGKPCITEIDGSKTYLTPKEARLRNATYSAPMYFETKLVDRQTVSTDWVYVGEFPVMAKSILCPLSKMSREELIDVGDDPIDPGGYFIVNGSERVIVGLEDLAPNKVLVGKEKRAGAITYQATIYSSVIGYRSKLEIVLKKDKGIFIRSTGLPTEIPFTILMRALGFEKDKEITEAVSFLPEIQDLLESSFESFLEVETTEQALEYLGNRLAPGMLKEARIARAENFLDWTLLPHIGRSKEVRKEKALFLGEAVNKLLEFKLGWIPEDDRDHYSNKIILLAGELLADIFRTTLRAMVKDLQYQLRHSGQKRSIKTVNAAVRTGFITDKLRNAIATGNWGRGKVGITQLLDRTNRLSTNSHLRRVQSPLSRTQPNFEARELHPTHFGRICPCETPEGSNCGLVKNLALSAVISTETPLESVRKALLKIGLIPYQEADIEARRRGARVYINGRFSGYTLEADAFIRNFKQLRRGNKIKFDVNVQVTKSSEPKATTRVYVNAYAGRVLKPLIILENGKPLVDVSDIQAVKEGKLSFSDLVAQGKIEFVDTAEEENCLIAWKLEDVTEEHTHLELTPVGMLGAIASLIPYAEHNQSPRNTYESAMAKQALGYQSPVFTHSGTQNMHLLVYPQKPLVTTRTLNLLDADKRPFGVNAVVAILSYDCYNIADAIVINKSAVDRGFGRSFFYRLYEADLKQYLGGMKDEFAVPTPGSNVKGYKGEKYYRLLEPDGAVYVEANVKGGDVLIGRVSPPRFMSEYQEAEVGGLYMRDTSVTLRPSEAGVADVVFLTTTSEGNMIYRVLVRELRVPELGDKFASRHGQKGVVGLLVPQKDMPYTEDGIVPDIILNPHALPSRMTVGQFLESISGKVAALTGTPVDGTPFLGEPSEELERTLEEFGFVHTGREVMYDGRTGKRFSADVFVGIAYYQKLHHMVADKIHARARGQVQMLTKQPTEGRSRGGGLRFGEMERDCLIAYGAASLLKDRLLDESDKTEVYVCENCGLVAYYDIRHRRYICRVCRERARIVRVAMAYAFKLLIQEMMSLGIAPRIILKDKV